MQVLFYRGSTASGSRPRNRPSEPPRRRGIAALWLIVALPVLLVAMCFAIESGRMWLIRQQVSVSLESASLAAVRDCARRSGGGTLPSRQAAIELARVNTADGAAVPLNANHDPTALPNENASCSGDIVLGTILERAGGREFHAELPFGCSDASTGPKAAAFRRISTDSWQQVTFCDRTYAAMVVVGTPSYTELTTPAVVRIRSVTASGFEFLVQSVNTGLPVPNVPVQFLTVESGVYSAADDGITMEATRYSSVVTDRAGAWLGEPRVLLNAYVQPVVVGQVMTFNDPRWSVFWSRGASRLTPADSIVMRTGKHIGEDPTLLRAPETVGYIVFEAGSGHLRGLPVLAGQGPETVRGMSNNPPYTCALPGSPVSPGGFAVASQTGMRGGNGSWAALYGPDPVTDARLNLALDEDQLNDAERSHITERVNYVVLAGPCAARTRAAVDVGFLCDFGCPLAPTTMRSTSFAVFDCVTRQARLTTVDAFFCRP